MKNKQIKIFSIVGTAALLSACASLQPTALTNNEIATTTQADRIVAQQDVEPLTGDLSLEEAIARAIKYNSERRLRTMEEAVASGTFEASRYDMLPQLVAAAGYRERSNDLLTLQKDLSTGETIGGETISSSRRATTTDLSLSWSLLDFGQSYYAARQNADRVLIAAERRRKTLHLLTQDVQTAFWRTASAQKLSSVLRQTITDAEAALQDAQVIEQEGLRSPLEPLRYQRQLLENLRLLEAIEQELSTARVELAALVNLPLMQDFRVVEPSAQLNSIWLDTPADEMEAHALLQNADLRESMYNARIAQLETRRALLKLFPGISFNYGHKTSNDDFLINQSWNEAGVQISFNLLGLLAAPAQMQLADAGIALADQKRVTTQLAVLSQLHIARLLYRNATHQFDRANTIANVDSRIAEHVNNQAHAAKLGRQERVAQQTAAILSLLRRYQALSNAQAAASRLQATLGLEPNLEDSANLSLAELSDKVGQSLETWASGELPPVPRFDTTELQ
ncbi:TolC family protein [Pseudomonas benzenivorans]|uniref:TolC family protein n=1 Tax=Pseudomonas benzenivorans TaxID=556533 RepID=A0ABY5H6D2_9PSED|nr:TolC family protein [Pseudomonas benzenivorans]UTW06977.1 TolC family protein [Pseudomonas benzenivorans]